MILQFIAGAPLWVWPLLVLLIMIGLRATRRRTTPALLFYLLPLLVAINLVRLFRLDPVPGVWAAYFLAYAIGAAAGAAMQKHWLLACGRTWIELKGEWVTLLTVMVIFWSNYLFGVLNAIRPDLAMQAKVQIEIFTPVGFFAGTLLGRALRVAYSTMKAPAT